MNAIGNRSYDEKYSHALTNLQCLRSTLSFIKSDMTHLRKRNDYNLEQFQKDFDKIEKDFNEQLNYLSEMTTEIQKTYKMY